MDNAGSQSTQKGATGELAHEAACMSRALCEKFVADEAAEHIRAYELLGTLCGSAHIEPPLSEKVANDGYMRKRLGLWLRSALSALNLKAVRMVMDGHGGHWVTGLRPLEGEARLCGTPGCTYLDRHGGACSVHTRSGKRRASERRGEEQEEQAETHHRRRRASVPSPPTPPLLEASPEAMDLALLRTEVATLRRERAALVAMLAAPCALSARATSADPGDWLGASLTYGTPLGEFQGRVIRELDGDRVRVLFFDSEATYDRSQLTDAGVSVNPVRAHKRRPRLAAFAAALPPVPKSAPLPEAPTTRLRK
jgi:hypothetical protein